MIVLDEQLLGDNLDLEIAKWYRGGVKFVTDLRPNTIIKDDAIAQLLRQQNQPTFVTINEKDFWRRVAIDKRFCVVCFVVADYEVWKTKVLSRQHELEGNENASIEHLRVLGMAQTIS